jgi:hypothetical protein
MLEDILNSCTPHAKNRNQCSLETHDQLFNAAARFDVIEHDDKLITTDA